MRIKHYGDITKINGFEVPSVDIVTGGSPCQDLSVAGKRAGLDGERSGLFMEQIRVIKEMRENDRRNRDFGSDKPIRPRWMVWENVAGAFSSNKGEDFRIVLEETARIADKTAVIPEPPKGGWTHSGCVMGDGWSIAWRLHDAQFWGVPQRRKRIALVADFGGLTAPEILFERQGVSGNTEQSGTPGERAASASEGDTNPSSWTLNQGGMIVVDQGGGKSQCSISENVSPTLATTHGGEPVIVIEGNGARESHKGPGYSESDKMYTLNTVEQHAVCASMQAIGEYKIGGVASSLKQRDYKDATDLMIQ